MKNCVKCSETKSIERFHKNSRSKDGHSTVCASCHNSRNRTSYLTPTIQKQKKEYRAANAARSAINSAQYREDNAEALYLKRRANVERKKAMDREYSKNNPAKIVAKAARRRAMKLQATPSWASKAYIDIFYEMAKDEELRTGRKVHVDHIVPLNSDIVCGLHCEDNLQLLFQEDNGAKSNIFWPDMP